MDDKSQQDKSTELTQPWSSIEKEEIQFTHIMNNKYYKYHKTHLPNQYNSGPGHSSLSSESSTQINNSYT